MQNHNQGFQKSNSQNNIELYFNPNSEDICIDLCIDATFKSPEEELQIKQKYEKIENAIKLIMEEMDEQLLLPSKPSRPRPTGLTTTAAKPGFMAKRGVMMKTPGKLVTKTSELKIGKSREVQSVGLPGQDSINQPIKIVEQSNQVILIGEKKYGNIVGSQQCIKKAAEKQSVNPNAQQLKQILEEKFDSSSSMLRANISP